MNKEIQALDLAIAKLQEEKEKAIKKAETEAKNKQEKSNKKITHKDNVLIKKLAKQAEWWKNEGPEFEKSIKVTIKGNILWTEEKRPHIDGYDILYNGKSLDFDDLVRSNLFEKELKTAQKEINQICNLADSLEKKYPDAKIEIFT